MRIIAESAKGGPALLATPSKTLSQLSQRPLTSLAVSGTRTAPAAAMVAQPLSGPEGSFVAASQSRPKSSALGQAAAFTPPAKLTRPGEELLYSTERLLLSADRAQQQSVEEALLTEGALGSQAAAPIPAGEPPRPGGLLQSRKRAHHEGPVDEQLLTERLARKRAAQNSAAEPSDGSRGGRALQSAAKKPSPGASGVLAPAAPFWHLQQHSAADAASAAPEGAPVSPVIPAVSPLSAPQRHTALPSTQRSSKTRKLVPSLPAFTPEGRVTQPNAADKMVPIQAEHAPKQSTLEVLQEQAQGVGPKHSRTVQQASAPTLAVHAVKRSTTQKPAIRPMVRKGLFQGTEDSTVQQQPVHAGGAVQDACTESAGATQQDLCAGQELEHSLAKPSGQNKRAVAAAQSMADHATDALSVFSFL